MRFRRMIPAAAALAAVLVAPLPGASAFKHSSPAGGCQVSIEVAPRLITAGEAVTVFGRLHCRRPAGAADRVVRLFHHVVGEPGYSYVQSTVTNAYGFYEIENADAPVTSNRAFFVRTRGAESGRREVRVASEVTLQGPAEGTTLYTGRANAVTFTGKVSPEDPGARVILQRQNAVTGNEWHNIDRGVVQAGGSFSITHVFRYPGDADIRVLVRSQGRNLPGISNVLTYEISQAQNTALTINASNDPITFGQSVTISGTLAGGAEQPVTLYARTARQRFGPVAEVNTNAEGDYTFPAQMPAYSTFYEVQGAGKRSAVLYEGVNDVLTASVSTTTVQAGQPVTFSGTVAPDHTGDIIYLERRNASGVGYHVIQVAIVGAGSTYSIEHRFYAPGPKIVRIYVPGGPDNAGTASQPFTIEVTPAPASALTPEASNNTSRPSQGQVNGPTGEETATEGLETEAQPVTATEAHPGSETHHLEPRKERHGKEGAARQTAL